MADQGEFEQQTYVTDITNRSAEHVTEWFLVAKEKDRPFDPLYDLSDEEETEKYIQRIRKAARLRRELREVEEQMAEAARARMIRARDTRNQSESTTPNIGLDARPSGEKSSSAKEALATRELLVSSS